MSGGAGYPIGSAMEDDEMSTTAAVPDWIRRIVDEERAREAVRTKDEEIAARKSSLIQSLGPSLVGELQATIVRDVQAFCAERVGGRERGIVVEPMPADAGFTVRKPLPSAVSLSVVPNFDGAAINCHYRFTHSDGLPAREDRVAFVFAADGDGGLRLRHHGTGQVFATADALSEFLLTPVLTGRPRN